MNVANAKSADWAGVFQRLWNRYAISVTRTRPPTFGETPTPEVVSTFRALIVPEDWRPQMRWESVGLQNAADPAPTFVLVRPEVRYGGDSRSGDIFTFQFCRWICSEVDLFEFGLGVGIACKRLRVMRESLE